MGSETANNNNITTMWTKQLAGCFNQLNPFQKTSMSNWESFFPIFRGRKWNKSVCSTTTYEPFEPRKKKSYFQLLLIG